MYEILIKIGGFMIDVKYIKEKNIVTFMFCRYLEILNTVKTNDAEMLVRRCYYSIENYDAIYSESGINRLYRDLGFYRGFLFSIGKINIDEDEMQFKTLLNSIDNQSPENLY